MKGINTKVQHQLTQLIQIIKAKTMVIMVLCMILPWSLLAETVCAVVKIEIRQELSFERQAFDAKMVITNGLEVASLENLDIDVVFYDLDGNPVRGSSDTDADPFADPNNPIRFFVTVDSIEGVNDVNGDGVINAGEKAEIHWLIIPVPGAGGLNPIGKRYSVGATVEYTYGEESQTVQVAPDFITVRPNPLLKLDYFIPDDVFGDDPLTQAVEPIEPFDLGLRIKNTGGGDAYNLKIESAQPEIIENNQGLLIDFTLLGSSVNDSEVRNSLLADIGLLRGGESSMVSWLMSTSLAGEFVSFEADYYHSDEYGGALTSLIDDPIDTHTLLHRVKVDYPGRDQIRDFLAHNSDELTDATPLTVYESNGNNSDVTQQAATLSGGTVVNGRQNYSLSFAPTVGAGFVWVADPYQGIKQEITAFRSDGKVVAEENVWQFKIQQNPGEFLYYIALFDVDSTGQYTLIVSGGEPNVAPVISVNNTQNGVAGQQMEFDIEVTDANEGDVLSLLSIVSPSGSSVTNIAGTTWQFSWLPSNGDVGNHPLVLRASDGAIQTDLILNLIVTAGVTDDTDGDGLDDAWEQQYFGDLDEDGTGDFDLDSATDLQEHDFGGDPTVEDRPQAVDILNLTSGEQITDVPAEFMIVNSVSAEDAGIVYEFEIYQGSLQHLYYSETVTESEFETTLWSHQQLFTQNERYIWRVRAFDGVTYSNWSYDEFFLSSSNGFPQFCALDYPENGAVVNEQIMELAVIQGSDQENDDLQYRFEVFEDAEMSISIADSGWLAGNDEHIKSWQPYLDYEFDTDYYWTASVSDGNTEIECANSHFTTGINIPVETGYQLNAPVDNALTLTDIDLVVDANIQSLVYFEIDEFPDFSSQQLQQSGGVQPDSSGQAIWQLSALDAGKQYYWRARAVEGAVTRLGRWQYGRFTTQGLDGAPSIQMVNPSNQSWVSTRTPELKFSIDQFAGFAENFQIDVFEDQAATLLVDSQVIDSQTYLSPQLNDRAYYYWQAKGLHTDGSETPYSPMNQFFVIDDLVDEVPDFEFVSLQQATNTTAGVFRILWVDSDADSDAVIDLYYDSDDSGQDGVLIAAGLSEDGVDYYDWDVTELTGETVYLYAVISDASSNVTKYSLDNLRIDESAIEVMAVNNTVSEAGDQVTVSVTLVQQPEDYVVIPVTVSDETEITTDVNELFFDSVNWSVPQQITVTGVDDALVDGDQNILLQFGPVVSADPVFAAEQINDLALVNIDDDIPGVLFVSLGDNITSELGDEAAFEVSLMTEPDADVILDLLSSDETEGLLDATQLVFTIDNWYTPQVLTVMGQDDFVADGDMDYQINTQVSSADVNYADMLVEDITLSNTDDDSLGINLTAMGGSDTTEAGGSAAFEMSLNSQPLNEVTLVLTSSNEAEGIADTSSLVFTTENWNQVQVFNVIGQNDDVADGDVEYLISIQVSSDDPNYAATPVDDISLSNVDDDVVGVNVTALGDLNTTESGGSTAFEVSLNSEPLNEVTVVISSSDEAEGLVDIGSLIFTSENWNQVQNFNVIGQDDDMVDGDVAYSISLVSSSLDTGYENTVIGDINLINTDNDIYAVILNALDGQQTSEAGSSLNYMVSLSAEPSAVVNLSIVSSDPSEGLTSPLVLTFDAADWHVAKQFTVHGQDDSLVDGDQTYFVDIDLSSVDANYDELNVPSIELLNVDDDVAGITVSPTSGLITTEQGGTAVFSVVLQSEPTADVNLTFSSSDTTEGEVDTTLSFTALNWNTPQEVVVSGVDDVERDGDVAYTVLTSVSSTDNHYDSLVVDTVNVTNTDDEVAGIGMIEMTGLETSEDGDKQALFRVALNLQPSADVVLDFNVSDATEGQIASSQMVFTATNWSESQVLTVNGVDDDLTDYDVSYDLSYEVTSADSEYAALEPEVITLVNLDDDVPQQNDIYYTDLNSSKAEAVCNAAAAQVSDPAQVCVPSELGEQHPNWSYNGWLRWPANNGIDYHATYYYGINCPVGSYLDTDKGCVNEDDQGLQTMSPEGEGGGVTLAESINVATGNHYYNEPLIDLGGGLTFGITYNSHIQVDAFGDPSLGLMGAGWTHDYNRSISTIYDVNGIETVDVTRQDGRIFQYSKINDVWVAGNHQKSVLQQHKKGWTLLAKNGEIEQYDPLGRLVNIQLKSGEQLTISHETALLRVSNEFGQFITINYQFTQFNQSVKNIADHTNRTWSLSYAADNLASITFPGKAGLTKVYHYEDSSHSSALTGVTDQRGIRYSHFSHDAAGRIISSELAGGVNRIDVNYETENTRILTNSLGTVSNLVVEKDSGLWLLKSIVGPGCSTCDLRNTDYTFDGNNNLISKTVNGVTTEYSGYDSKGQYGRESHAVGTADVVRKDYTYDARFFGKVSSVTEGSVYTPTKPVFKVTQYAYNSKGRPTTISVNGYRPDGTAINQTTTYEYNGPFGQVSLKDGPLPGLIDSTVYTYYPNSNPVETRRNRLKRVTGPEGIIERNNIRWSATGKITSEDLPNDVTQIHFYDADRDLIDVSSLSDNATAIIQTQNTYLATGQMASVSLNYGSPEETTLSMAYDDALRLTRVTDELGNYVEYTLDTEGNQIAEQVFDLNGTLKKQINKTFDDYGYVSGLSQSGVNESYSHDNNGALINKTNGNNIITDYSYDSLQRLSQITQDYQAGGSTSFVSDTGNTVTHIVNALGSKTVIDARGNETIYKYDDLGNLVMLNSPDTGITHYEYDAGGNVISETDANGNNVLKSYDGRSRVTLIDYTEPTSLGIGSSLDTTYDYDQGVNGAGMMSGFIDHSGSTNFDYDAFGNLLSKAQVVNGFNISTYNGFNELTISHTYDSYNRMTTMSYPSGMTLNYEYNALNQIERISTTVDGISETVVDNVTYLPMGPVESIEFGNNKDHQSYYDNGYRLQGFSYNNKDITAVIAYDNNHNITAIDREQSVNNDSFSYDELDRLTYDSNDGPMVYAYDRVGNRISSQKGRQLTIPYLIDANSNRLLQIGNNKQRSYDANGNNLTHTETGDDRWTYNAANKMSTFSNGKVLRAVYYYNALGQRVHKTHNKVSGALAGEFLYVYDEQGRLVHVSKYKNGNHLWDRETIWLGYRPVAQVRKFYSGNTVSTDDIYYIQADHLNTPRWITDHAGKRIWSWESDAFGNSAPVIDVDGDGSNFHFYMRFSGHYFDGESGMHYNYFRDYEPMTGRYLQSNPLGSSIDVNSYDFLNSSPIRYSDSSGVSRDIPGLCDGFSEVLGKSCRNRLLPYSSINQRLKDHGINLLFD